MRIISQVKVDTRNWDINDQIQMNYIQSDIARAFANELIKNRDSIETVTYVREEGVTFAIISIEAILVKMETIHKVYKFCKELGLSPDRLEQLKKLFIEEL
jgi:hypothetical protein